MIKKPAFWPKNPYPADLFVLPRESYAAIVPDEVLRTGLSGMLGREFWEIASNTIWERLLNEAMEEENDEVLRFLQGR